MSAVHRMNDPLPSSDLTVGEALQAHSYISTFDKKDFEGGKD